MRAWIVEVPGPVERHPPPLRLAELPLPRPAPGELLVRVEACGICRTDLHVVEGELPLPRLPVVPGHQVVGTVVEAAEPHEPVARAAEADPAAVPAGRHAETAARPAGRSVAPVARAPATEGAAGSTAVEAAAHAAGETAPGGASTPPTTPPPAAAGRGPAETGSPEAAQAPGAAAFRPGDRVGIAWLRWTCGACRFCTSGRENLCPDARFTGYHADGGYAEYTTVPARFAYRLPAGLTPLAAAPLLCAGIIGHRALRLSGIRPGGRLGLYGFGAAAHLAIQVARHMGCEIYVFTRTGEHGDFARSLGAAWVGRSDEPPPAPLDAAIIFAPAGQIVPAALRALDRGGTLALAGIHMSPIPPLDYSRDLYFERTIRSVTANTRVDGEEFLRLAAEIPVRTEIERVPFEGAAEALARLKRGEVRGAAVLEAPAPPRSAQP